VVGCFVLLFSMSDDLSELFLTNSLSLLPPLLLQWDGDLNKIKDAVKEKIENMAATWSDEEKKECVDATASAFQGGGSINGYLAGRVSQQ